MNLKQEIIKRGLSLNRLEGGWTPELIKLYDDCQNTSEAYIAKKIFKTLGPKTKHSYLFTLYLLRGLLNKNINKVKRGKKCDKVSFIYATLSFNYEKKLTHS